MKNIVLIGMPSAGKTTIGKQLAERLNVPFYDMDDVIVETTGKTIKELFAVSEDYFRQQETEVARALAQKEGVVIACGGGVIKRKENIDLLGATGTILFLNRAPEDIIKDVDISTRPLLAAGRHKIMDLYAQRFEYYVKYSDHIVDVEDPFIDTIPKIVKHVDKEYGVIKTLSEKLSVRQVILCR